MKFYYVENKEQFLMQSWYDGSLHPQVICSHGVDMIILEYSRLSTTNVNSSPPNAAYMCQWIGYALIQIMACHLFGSKPLYKPMLDNC